MVDTQLRDKIAQTISEGNQQLFVEIVDGAFGEGDEASLEKVIFGDLPVEVLNGLIAYCNGRLQQLGK